MLQLLVMGAQELQDYSPVKQLRYQSEIEGGSLSLDGLVEDVVSVQETNPKAPPSSPVSRDDPTIETPGTSGTHGKSQMEEVIASGNPAAARSATGKVTVKEMVEWISVHHKTLKLPEIEDEGTEINDTSNSASQDQSDENSQSSETQPQLICGSDKQIDPQKPSSEKIGTVQRGMSPEELQRIEDYQFLALAKRDLKQLEAEIELCCQETAGLHGGVRQEMERNIESALRTIKHGGDIDANQAIEYNDKLLEMRRQFEYLSARLQKAKIDLATIKQVVSGCARLRCKCWWCRGYNIMRKLVPAVKPHSRPSQKYEQKSQRNEEIISCGNI